VVGIAPRRARRRLRQRRRRGRPGLKRDRRERRRRGARWRLSGSAAEVEAALLGELQEVHWAIHRAFSEHQRLSEDRRHLAAEIGELIAAFISELVAAGWSEEQARNADVHQLATAVAR